MQDLQATIAKMELRADDDVKVTIAESKEQMQPETKEGTIQDTTMGTTTVTTEGTGAQPATVDHQPYTRWCQTAPLSFFGQDRPSFNLDVDEASRQRALVRWCQAL